MTRINITYKTIYTAQINTNQRSQVHMKNKLASFPELWLDWYVCIWVLDDVWRTYFSLSIHFWSFFGFVSAVAIAPNDLVLNFLSERVISIRATLDVATTSAVTCSVTNFTSLWVHSITKGPSPIQIQFWWLWAC